MKKVFRFILTAELLLFLNGCALVPVNASSPDALIQAAQTKNLATNQQTFTSNMSLNQATTKIRQQILQCKDSFTVIYTKANRYILYKPTVQQLSDNHVRVTLQQYAHLVTGFLDAYRSTDTSKIPASFPEQDSHYIFVADLTRVSSQQTNVTMTSTDLGDRFGTSLKSWLVNSSQSSNNHSKSNVVSWLVSAYSGQSSNNCPELNVIL